MLNLSVSKADFDALPEAVKKHYKANEAGDTFALESDAGTKVDEFRNTNITLQQTLNTTKTDLKTAQDAAAKFEGVDVAEYQRLRAGAQKAGAKDGDFESSEMFKTLTGRIDVLEQINATQTAQLETQTLNNILRTAAKAAGGAPTMEEDILLRASADGWALGENNQPVRKVAGADYLDPLTAKLETVSDYFTRLFKAKPGFAAPSGGGGGKSGDSVPGDPYTVNANDPVAMGKAAADLGTGKAVALIGGASE